MKAPKFEYARPESLDRALELLDEHGDDARILAGGQSLMPTLNMRLSTPRILIDINRIDELKGISVEGDEVRIGALARHAEVMRSAAVARHLPLIAEAMPQVAHVAVRNRGTFGGSIALADPAAELPACALACSASFVLASRNGRRTVAAADFFKGLYETARRADEILVETRAPAQRPGYVSAFTELSRRHGDFALSGVACHGRVEGRTFADLRLVYFASEDRPRLAPKAIAAAEAGPWSDERLAAVQAALADDLDPIDNLHGSPAMKLHLARVLTGRLLAEALQRAGAA